MKGSVLRFCDFSYKLIRGVHDEDERGKRVPTRPYYALQAHDYEFVTTNQLCRHMRGYQARTTGSKIAKVCIFLLQHIHLIRIIIMYRLYIADGWFDFLCKILVVTYR